MRSLRYLFTLVAGIAILSTGVWLVYSQLGTQRSVTAGVRLALSEPAPAQNGAPYVAPPPVAGDSAKPATIQVAGDSAESAVVRSTPGTAEAIPATATAPSPPAATVSTPAMSTPVKVTGAVVPVVTEPPKSEAPPVTASQGATPAPTSLTRDSANALALQQARNLAWSGDVRAATEQYSRLIEEKATAQLLLERGRLQLWSGAEERGVADLHKSVEIEPLAEAMRLLGDYYRWQGELAASANWYRRAAEKAPTDSEVLNGMALLSRAVDRSLLRPGELWSDSFGARLKITGDNAGYGLSTLSASHALPVGTSTTLSLGVEARTVSVASTSSASSQLGGFGGDATIGGRTGMARLSASAGVLKHDGLDASVRAHLSADVLMNTTRVGVAIKRAPAYEALWSARLLDFAFDGPDSSVRSSTASEIAVSTPFAFGTALHLSGEYLNGHDANSRLSFSASLRKRLSTSFWLLYAGGTMWWDQQVGDYYSPASFLSQSLGLEFSSQREHGLSINTRLLPGYAWMREEYGVPGLSGLVSREAFQFMASTDFVLRGDDWDLMLSTALGTGREGGYRSGSATLQLRRSW